MNSQNEIESRLQHALRSVAQDVVTVKPVELVVGDVSRVETVRRAPSRSRVVRGLAVAAAVAVLGGGLYIAVDNLRGDSSPSAKGEPGEAACADEITWQGQRYVARGELARVPVPGDALEPATRVGCDDGNGPRDASTASAWVIPGVEPQVALLLDNGVVYEIPRTKGGRPAALEALYQRVECVGPGTGDGILTSTSSRPGQDGSLWRTPYTVTLAATGGSILDTANYSMVELKIQVTGDTVGGTDERLLVSALQEGRPVSVDLTCTNQRFVAVSLDLLA